MGGNTFLFCVRWQNSWWLSPMRAGSTCLTQLKSTLGGSEWCLRFVIYLTPTEQFSRFIALGHKVFTMLASDQEIFTRGGKQWKVASLQSDLHNLIHHWRLSVMFTAQSNFINLDIVFLNNVGQAVAICAWIFISRLPGKFRLTIQAFIYYLDLLCCWFVIKYSCCRCMADNCHTYMLLEKWQL